MSNSTVKIARKPGFINFEKLYSYNRKPIRLSTHKEVDYNYENNMEVC